MRKHKPHNRLGLRQQFIVEVLRDAPEMTAKEIAEVMWKKITITASKMASLYESLRGLERIDVVRSRKETFGFRAGRTYVKFYRLIPHRLEKIEKEKQKRGWKL